MSRLQRYVLTMVSTAIVLFFALGVAMLGSQMATAAPAQQEIPAAASGAYRPAAAQLFNSAVTSATAVWYGPAVDVMSFDESEINYVIDQAPVAGVPNTVSLALENSWDRVNWTRTVITAGNFEDKSLIVTDTAPIGRYWRLRVAPTNANPVTVTVNAVLEP